MSNIFLFGAGYNCKVVIDIVEKEAKNKIVGIIDSKREIGAQFNGYQIIGRQANIVELSKKYKVNKGIVSVGDNFLRSKIVEQIKVLKPDFEFVNAIHPSVIIGKNVKIGQGNILMPGVIMNTFAQIENYCIINTGSVLEHDCKMEDFSSLATGVKTGGLVVIKKFTAVAIGAILRDRVTVGEHSVIGMGAVVTKDIPSFSVAYGIPAKIIGKRKIGEKYMK